MAWKAIEINDNEPTAKATEPMEQERHAETADQARHAEAQTPSKEELMCKHLSEIEFTLKAMLAHMQSKSAPKPVVTFNERHDG